MAKAFKRSGFDGIIVTNHFFNGNTTVPSDLDWETRVHLFCLGYEIAKSTGDKIGLDVFFGWEYTWEGADFLTYGLDANWLLDNSDVLEWDITKYFEMVHKSNGFIVHAHPFREAHYIKKIQLFTEYIDAVEVKNAGNNNPAYDASALAYADKYNFPKTIGSDAHSDQDMERCNGMIFNNKLKSIQDFISSVKHSIDL